MSLTITPIKQRIHRYLDQHSQCQEHALIHYLLEQDIEPYCSLGWQSAQQTFQLHFITKHALYLLQEDYRQAGQFALQITLTRIQRSVATQCGANALGEPDPVRDYYLNLAHFYDTRESDVNALLNQFWQRYLAFNDRHQAYAVLNLAPGASLAEVKQRYRELAQTHHPDRGGNAEQFIALTDAKNALCRTLTS